MGSDITRRRALMQSFLRQRGVDTDLSESAAANQASLAAELSAQLPELGADSAETVAHAIVQLDAVADASLDPEWPGGCTGVADILGLDAESLRRLGITSLPQKLSLRKAAERATGTVAAVPANPAPSLAEQLRARRAAAARQGDTPPSADQHAPASVPPISVSTAILSDSPWLGAAEVQKSRNTAQREAPDAPVLGAAVSAIGTLWIAFPSMAWWVLVLVAAALLVVLAVAVKQRRGAKATMALLGAMALEFIVSFAGADGSPTNAVASGAVATLYGAVLAAWVGFDVSPVGLLAPHARTHVAMLQDVSQQFPNTRIAEIAERKGMRDEDLPELSDRALHDAGFLSSEEREAFRAALRPQKVTAASPLWRQFWQSGAISALAAVWTVVGTVMANMRLEEAYAQANLAENQRQTAYAREAAAQAQAARSLAAQARQSAQNATCTFKCQKQHCSTGWFGRSYSYGELINEQCDFAFRSNFVCTNTNGACR